MMGANKATLLTFYLVAVKISFCDAGGSMLMAVLCSDKNELCQVTTVCQNSPWEVHNSSLL